MKNRSKHFGLSCVFKEIDAHRGEIENDGCDDAEKGDFRTGDLEGSLQAIQREIVTSKFKGPQQSK